MSKKKRAQCYRVGLIGCGSVAEHGHLPALLSHERFDLVAVCDIVPKRSGLLSKQAGGIPEYRDYRQLLRHAAVDACVLAVGPEISVGIALDCLYLGKAVLDEKPLAVRLEDGEQLAREVSSRRGIYQIGFCFRYSDWVLQLSELSRSLGSPTVHHVQIFDEVVDRKNMDHFVRIQEFLRSSSVINHEGSHVIDYYRIWNASPLVTVRATSERTESDLRGPNLWNAQFWSADGSVLNLRIGWLLRERRTSHVTISGAAGTASIGVDGCGEIVRHGTVMPVRIPPLRQEFDRQLDAFARAMDQRIATEATVGDGLTVLTITKACERAATHNAVVQIPTGTQPAAGTAKLAE